MINAFIITVYVLQKWALSRDQYPTIHSIMDSYIDETNILIRLNNHVTLMRQYTTHPYHTTLYNV